MTSYTERDAWREGRRIYVRDYPGPEPALVLMHGFPDSLELYDRLVEHLAGERRLVLFDFVGWGRSDKSRGNVYSFDNLTRDLDAVIVQLRLERPDLVAHDASGPPAIEWSLANPDRAGHLVLLNTFYMMMLRLRPPEGVFLYMMPLLKYVTRAANRLSSHRLNRHLYRWQIRRFLRDERDREEVVAYLYGHWKTSWRAFQGLVGRLLFQSIRYARKENLDRLRAYPGRVRIVFGAKDPYLNVHVARRFHELFPASELFVLDDAYHYVQIDEPEQVARLILDLRRPGAVPLPRTADPAPSRSRPRPRNLRVPSRSRPRPRNLRVRLLEPAFGVDYAEVSFAVRGFERCEPRVETRIEEYFAHFLDGYHLALRTRDLDALGAALEAQVPGEFVGFAYEGAGMYLALRDYLSPVRGRRLERFVAGPAAHYDFVTLIGIGLAAARLPWVRRDLEPTLRRLDPGLCWFAVDGYGFHEGFFRHRRFVDRAEAPRRLSPYAARCFDNGLGRALWFVKGADPERIGAAVDRFPDHRRGDLWAGIGLACAYAGGVCEDLDTYEEVVEKLRGAAAAYADEFGLGVVFAAYARQRAGTGSPWTARACELVLSASPESAAAIGDEALGDSRLAVLGAPRRAVRGRRYEDARERIRHVLAARRGGAG